MVVQLLSEVRDQIVADGQQGVRGMRASSAGRPIARASRARRSGSLRFVSSAITVDHRRVSQSDSGFAEASFAGLAPGVSAAGTPTSLYILASWPRRFISGTGNLKVLACVGLKTDSLNLIVVALSLSKVTTSMECLWRRSEVRISVRPRLIGSRGRRGRPRTCSWSQLLELAWCAAQCLVRCGSTRGPARPDRPIRRAPGSCDTGIRGGCPLTSSGPSCRSISGCAWLTGMTLQAIHRRHLGVQARAAQREVRLADVAMPAASSDALALQLLGHDTAPPEAGDPGRAAAASPGPAPYSLDPAEREVLALRHFEELTNVEASRVLNISEAAASKRYLSCPEEDQGTPGSASDEAQFRDRRWSLG